jgi:hypothetical protein
MFAGIRCPSAMGLDCLDAGRFVLNADMWRGVVLGRVGVRF